jgi:hypothetical protein
MRWRGLGVKRADPSRNLLEVSASTLSRHYYWRMLCSALNGLRTLSTSTEYDMDGTPLNLLLNASVTSSRTTLSQRRPEQTQIREANTCSELRLHA